MHSSITGIILSGGKSNRMGVNKSFLRLNGKTINKPISVCKIHSKLQTFAGKNSKSTLNDTEKILSENN